MTYTVSLNATEEQAMRYVAKSPQEWVDNVVKNRARIASDEIVNLYSQFKINKGEAITAVGTTAVIEAAYAEGVVGIAT